MEITDLHDLPTPCHRDTSPWVGYWCRISSGVGQIHSGDLDHFNSGVNSRYLVAVEGIGGLSRRFGPQAVAPRFPIGIPAFLGGGVSQTPPRVMFASDVIGPIGLRRQIFVVGG
jgi:hypothetical protein